MKICTVEGCDRKHIAKGYCTMHYQRVKHRGEAGPAGFLDTSGSSNPHWKGGRVRGGHESRYWMLFMPAHPGANSLGYVLEHRVIGEKMLGRYLTDGEIVHHVNEDPSDNRECNLRVMTQAEHARLHHTKKGVAA